MTLLVWSLLAGLLFSQSTSATTARAVSTNAVDILDFNLKNTSDKTPQLYANHEALFSSSIHNNSNEEIIFTSVIDIRNRDDISVNIMLNEGTLGSGKTSTVQTVWTPDREGAFVIREFFLGRDLDNPEILSSITSMTFVVGNYLLSDKPVAEDDKQPSGVPVDPAMADYTVLVYMVGSNLETNGNFATEDLGEMMKVGSTPQLNVIVETGGANGATTDDNRFLDFTKVQRHMVLKDEVKTLSDMGRQNMGDPKTLTDFLDYGITEFPAQKYVVILWDDGSGINGFGTDTQSEDSLTLTELKNAFSDAKAETKENFELIGFDACLMSTFEGINELDEYGNFLVSSQDLEPSTGWDYEAILAYLDKNPGADGLSLGRTIADSYFEHTKEKSQIYENYDSAKTATLSVIDLSKVDELDSSVTRLSNLLDKEMNSIFEAQMTAKAIIQTERYGIGSRMSSGHLDLYDFVNQLENAFPATAEQANEVYSSIEDVVAYEIADVSRTHSHGISIYAPIEESALGSTPLSEQNSLPAWKDFIQKYRSFLTADVATPKIEPFSYINEKFYGATKAADAYRIQFYVTKEVVEHTTAQVISFTEDNLVLDSQGKFEYPFSKDLISLCNGDEDCIPTSMYRYDTPTIKYAVFPVRLETDQFTKDVLLLYEESPGRSFEFIGAWPGVDDEGNASRELWPLQNGDRLYTSYYQFDLRNSEEYNKFVEGESIEVTENFGPSYHEYDDYYQITAAVCDYSSNCDYSSSFPYTS